MKTLVFITLTAMLVACSPKKASDICENWPPADSIGAVLINSLNDSLIYDYNFQTMGMHGVNKYGDLDNPMDQNAVKKMYDKFGIQADSDKIIADCFKIKGYFTSQLGKAIVTARFNAWTNLNDTTGEFVNRWGVILDSGQVIINSQELNTLTPDYKFENSYIINELSQKYCVVDIRRDYNNQVLLIYGFNDSGNHFFKPLINSIGTIAKINKCSFEAKSSGWYSN
jgi:hypothetical protein